MASTRKSRVPFGPSEIFLSSSNSSRYTVISSVASWLKIELIVTDTVAWQVLLPGGEEEGGAVADCALVPGAAVAPFDDLAHAREAYASAGELTRGVQALEWLKQPVRVCRVEKPAPLSCT